jgi:transposase
MNAVGIDIGAAKHVVGLFREGEQKAQRRVLRIPTNRQGFDQLASFIRETGAVSRIVMEASGHYWMPLASELRSRQLPVALVPPISAKYFARRTRQRAKSDPADARTLAAMGAVDEPAVRDPLQGAELREAARFALALVREQARVCQRIQRLIDLGFPELKAVWDDPTCRSALAVLRIAPTARQAARTRVERLARANHGSGHRAIGRGKAEELHRLVQGTIAVRELEDQLGFEMRLLIEQYDALERQISAAEGRVAEMLDGELARRLQTIPGVGPAAAATFIAEIGDITRFSDVDKLIAFAGVHAAEKSSGEKGKDPETRWRMAKTGSAYLRAALFQVALVGVKSNPVLRTHYLRKRRDGKSKMNALGHCMKKALRIVWGVWRSGRDFDPGFSSD